MNNTVILFEDEGYRAFLPLVYSRPIFDLRCGMFSLRERVEHLVGAAPAAICRGHLAEACATGRWPLGLLGQSVPVLLINGRAIDLSWLPDLMRAPIDTVFVSEQEHGARGLVLLGARLSPSLASAVLLYLLNQEGDLALAELERFGRVQHVATRLLCFPWDLIVENGGQIARDLALHLRSGGWPSLAEQPRNVPGAVFTRPDQIYIHPEARLDGPLAIDARDGPVIIDAARIEPFSFIQGPAVIGAGSLIASARIRGETTIGPVSRIGGEVEASIVQGFSNKHHDGFLGHSYLGEWVNIGAMTTNSDLKNTYGTIKVGIEGMGQIDSHVMKLGCFLSDHVKLGIGVHLNGGTMIGTGSNIFGVHFAPKTIPAFTWGGEVFREYRIDGMIDVARKVMSRRKQTLSTAQETALRDIFTMTRGHRSAMEAPGRARPADEDSLEALARAEADAIRASDPLEVAG